MKKQLEFIDSRGSTGGTITFEPGDRQLVKAVWFFITGTFTAAPGSAIDYNVDLGGGWAIRHQGAQSIGDIMSTNTLWPLRQLTASLAGYFNETNSGVGTSDYRAVMCYYFDHGEPKGRPHGNSLPLDGGEKLKFQIPAFSAATAVKLETAGYSVSVFLEFGEGVMRYIPKLFENSAASSTAKTESLPDNMFVLMVQNPAAGAANLNMAVYDGDGINVVSGPFRPMVALSNSKYDFEAGANNNFHWEFYGASQNLLSVKGNGYKLQLSAGTGAVNFAHVFIETNQAKLIRSAQIVAGDQSVELAELNVGSGDISASEVEGLNPGVNASRPGAQVITPQGSASRPALNFSRPNGFRIFR